MSTGIWNGLAGCIEVPAKAQRAGAGHDSTIAGVPDDRHEPAGGHGGAR